MTVSEIACRIQRGGGGATGVRPSIFWSTGCCFLSSFWYRMRQNKVQIPWESILNLRSSPALKRTLDFIKHCVHNNILRPLYLKILDPSLEAYITCKRSKSQVVEFLEQFFALNRNNLGKRANSWSFSRKARGGGGGGVKMKVIGSRQFSRYLCVDPPIFLMRVLFEEISFYELSNNK